MQSRNSMRTLVAVILSCWTCPILLSAADEPKLTIVHPIFSQMEDGESAETGDAFVPGETIYFRCLISGFKRGEKDAIHLTYQVEVKDAQGILVQKPVTGKEETRLSPEDKDWMLKVRDTIVVPPLAESGEYQVEVKAKDELGGTAAGSTTKFQVKGHDVAASDTLVVRNFRFFRGETDTKPIQIAAYRPGDSLWARFDMTGYKMGPGNALDVDYGLVVLRSDGSTAYSEPRAAAEQKDSFYPQRYQPGVLSLNFAKDQARGAYTIVLTVHDNIGHQTCETREKFTVE